MINVLVSGCNGKMGQEVINEIDKFTNLQLTCGFDKFDKGLNTFPVFSEIDQISEPVDVIIDFSIPECTLSLLEYAKSNNICIVIATTGFTDEQQKVIENYSKYIPIFKSANMSYDINLMCKILSWLAPLLKDTDIEIVETHHNRKVDAPSGTALLLADNINKSLDNSMDYNLDRLHKRGKRNKNEVGFSSIRGGNIVGEHSVLFMGEHETLEIKHTSYSRSVFANGALKAAEFIVNQRPGLYDMNEL